MSAFNPCRFPGCTSTYAGDHTFHPVYVADYRDHEIVRAAEAFEIANAARYPGALITYREGDAHSMPRVGYLVRRYVDERGNEVSEALTDDEIATLARAREGK